ncbi:MAG TPA: hypothetical protein VHC49_08920, partial [Mycobacteriales bacterium]|nr:hypothetical protein [Mycobacteriales bacterium]
LNGAVETVAPGPSPDTVYIGGSFSTVNGAAAKGIALLSTTTGAMVSSFHPPAMNGMVATAEYRGGRLFIGGTFTSVGGQPRGGLATLDPHTGAVTTYSTLSFTEHHNYNGTGADGAVGPKDLDISPDGKTMIVIGNFKKVNGQLRDQIARIQLTGTGAALDPNWATAAFSAACGRGAYDSYVRDVDFAPNGSYFAVVSTGGASTANTDGTRGVCDAAARFATGANGADVAPTWVDWTGDDTLLSVAATGSVVYVGGHQRWLNNPDGHDSAGPGATPRPGVAALDPVTGLPLAWNPGRNPRGEGAYAIFATTDGLYVGSDTEYIGNRRYERKRIAYFPLAGGRAPVVPTTPKLPANIYLGGVGATSNRLSYRHYDGRIFSNARTVNSPQPDWSHMRGAFVLNHTLYYSDLSGNFYRRSFNGTTFGPVSTLDPYDDPAWSNVQTGSGQTYRGAKSSFYSQMANVTGLAYQNGRIYYTLAGQPDLRYRYFNPNSTVIGEQEFTVAATGADFRVSKGFFIAGSSLYWVTQGGALHRMSFAGGIPVASSDTSISGPGAGGDGKDWRAYDIFIIPDGS